MVVLGYEPPFVDLEAT